MLGLKDFGSWLVFAAYITLFINNNLLVTATRNKANQYSYSTVLVVLLIEFSKLIVSTFMCLRNNSVKDLVKDLASNKKAFIYYLIPSGLYCIVNNLAFFNLLTYDPTTYTILLQFGIVITGLIYQCLFQRQLSWVQWVSLFILMLGCIIAQLNVVDFNDIQVNLSLLLIFIQLLCSSFAGVYNEYLLKHYSTGLSFWQQNVIMYADSCAWGLFMLTVTGDLTLKLFDIKNFQSLCKPLVIALICNNVTAGIVTSLFLSKLNSILKKFAVSIEIVILAIIGHMFMGQSITLTMAAAISLVSIAVVVYSIYPLQKINPASGLIAQQDQLTSKQLTLAP